MSSDNQQGNEKILHARVLPTHPDLLSSEDHANLGRLLPDDGNWLCIDRSWRASTDMLEALAR